MSLSDYVLTDAIDVWSGDHEWLYGPRGLDLVEDSLVALAQAESADPAVDVIVYVSGSAAQAELVVVLWLNRTGIVGIRPIENRSAAREHTTTIVSVLVPSILEVVTGRAGYRESMG